MPGPAQAATRNAIRAVAISRFGTRLDKSKAFVPHPSGFRYPSVGCPDVSLNVLLLEASGAPGVFVACGEQVIAKLR